jgi:protein-tyrosine phosphatase
VSLCQVGWADLPGVPPRDHLQIRLADRPGDNNNPHYAIDQAARAVAALRAEGKRVFLHGYAGQSRTPAVAARYAAITAGLEPGEAFGQVCAAIGRPVSRVSPELRAAVYELAGQAPPDPFPEPGSRTGGQTCGSDRPRRE